MYKMSHKSQCMSGQRTLCSSIIKLWGDIDQGKGIKSLSKALSVFSGLILKLRNLGTTRTLPRIDHAAKLSLRVRRALVMKVTKKWSL